MKTKLRALLVIAVLLAAQMACNLPSQTSQVNPIPGPNQTLTALFAVTPADTVVAPAAETITPTLPFVITATSPAPGQIPTATTAPTVVPTAVPTAAPTAVPTATYVVVQPTNPPPAATIPAVRPRGVVIAQYLNTPPVIDGDWGDWKDFTSEYPANNVVWGNANWNGADDLSSSFHVGWDNNYLYVAAKVHDDKYVQNASGANLYKGDGIEIMFDRQLQADYYYSQLSPDDFQLGISPGRPDPSGTKEAYLWFPSNIAGPRTNVKIGSLLDQGVYRVEAAIPWNVLETTPVSGGHYGFAIAIDDNDNPNENLQQKMVSNVLGYLLANPTTWGDLQLVK